MNMISPPEELNAKDFASDQEVRWCPGCGDYAILKTMQKTLPEIGARPENTVFVSGIGCSSRFPYYMSTYGFHTIHGRAPAIASGVKLSNPELDVWIITGDGDGLSIGGNHMLHVLRRNVNVQVLLFNNEIYGLTKGQYSPTSKPGLRTPSSPLGSIDSPISPCAFALGANARFVARAIDIAHKPLSSVLKRAHAHKGASFVEIFQNCVVFNDQTFSDFTDKKTGADNQIHVEHGTPLTWGKDNQYGLLIKPGTLELQKVTIGEDGVTESDILVHDETNRTMATMLAAMEGPDFPVALGVLFCDPGTPYEEAVRAVPKAPGKNVKQLLASGKTWTVD
ncbi:MAG: 2-oxoacid:ferredoxin oxidoreductase subunit beta [Alphaproteobacteria bacterium]|nr:2-oxoacid:ferredoxin oxidoreductase subunit beta [Rhodospirillales bacterium]MCW9045096.1 2-oxoacid:ferredoxin oxidoreductase subunit beta [Alphaproteobacteria bacterium]